MSADLMIEVWDNIKPMISTKERMYVADRLVEVFDEYGMLDGIEHSVGTDNVISTAIASYYGIHEDEDEDHEY